VLHAEFQSISEPILPTHFFIWRDDRFEPYSSRFLWGNPLGCIQCSRRCANPPGVQIQCLRDQIRDPTLTHFNLEARVILLEQFPAYSDGLNFRTSFPAGSDYRTSPELHIFVDLSVHASDLLSSFDHGYFYVI
jgi:hypothetical protein